MPEFQTLFLILDCCLFEGSGDTSDQARQTVQAQIKKTVPGFSLVFARERGIGSVGEGTTDMAAALLQEYRNKRQKRLSPYPFTC